MLLVRCAACRAKLWKYEKRGPGEVLRCHKERIGKMYALEKSDKIVSCPCGKPVGRDRGRFISMKAGAFTCSGTKTNL